MRDIVDHLTPSLRKALGSQIDWSKVEEIRIRVGRPIQVKTVVKEQLIDSCIPTAEDIARTIQLMAQNSWYARQEQVNAGFLSLPGGHRVGLGGQVSMEDGRVRRVSSPNSLNIRIARQVIGAADSIIDRLDRRRSVYSTLLVSPPGCGKTTLLRDIARQLSNRGHNVVIVDERSELAACFHGIPQLDVGIRTDVIDGCTKEVGVAMALRGLSPDVIVTDEIGHPRDAEVLADIVRSGVAVVTSCHGSSVHEVAKREWAKQSWGFFAQVIFLSKKRGPGTIEAVLSTQGTA